MYLLEGDILGICVGSSRCSLPLSPVSCSPTKTGGVDLDAASLNSVQFEEDFNSRTKNLGSGVGVGMGGYVRPDQFLDHLTVIKRREQEVEGGQHKVGML